MYSGFEYLASKTEEWEPYYQRDYPILFSMLQQFFSYTKNVIAFGFAALGASLAASVISVRFAEKETSRGIERKNASSESTLQSTENTVS
jgi:hypothetical protein